MEAYALSIIGVLALCLLSIVLAIYSGSSKGRAGALSGPVIPADDDNPLYRIDRVHLNSVEALAPFVVPAMLAMVVRVGPTTLAVLVWVHVAIRLVHLVIVLRGRAGQRSPEASVIRFGHPLRGPRRAGRPRNGRPPVAARTAPGLDIPKRCEEADPQEQVAPATCRLCSSAWTRYPEGCEEADPQEQVAPGNLSTWLPNSSSSENLITAFW
jgi:uncharacterized MAPEG superfamily protein